MPRTAKNNKQGGKKERQQMIMLRAPTQTLNLCKRFSLSSTFVSGATSQRFLSSGWTGSTEYGMTSVYQQARVLSMRVTVCPSSSTTICLFGTDRTGATAAGQTTNTVWAMQNAKVYNGGSSMLNPATYLVKATDFEDQSFDPIGAPVARFAAHLIVTGTTVTVSYFLEWEVELRGTI